MSRRVDGMSGTWIEINQPVSGFLRGDKGSPPISGKLLVLDHVIAQDLHAENPWLVGDLFPDQAKTDDPRTFSFI